MSLPTVDDSHLPQDLRDFILRDGEQGCYDWRRHEMLVKFCDDQKAALGYYPSVEKLDFVFGGHGAMAE